MLESKLPAGRPRISRSLSLGRALGATPVASFGLQGCLPERVVIYWSMTKDQVKEILDRVLAWPPERQADVAHMVEVMEAQDNSGVGLTEEQAAEVRRRLAEKDPKTLTLAEFNERLRQRYGL